MNSIPPDPIQQIIQSFHASYYMDAVIQQEYEEANEQREKIDHLYLNPGITTDKSQ